MVDENFITLNLLFNDSIVYVSKGAVLWFKNGIVGVAGKEILVTQTAAQIKSLLDA